MQIKTKKQASKIKGRGELLYGIQPVSEALKQRKRQFRSLWITKINAAARLHNMSYSQLINQLKKSDISINRKMLADLAVNNAKNFSAIVNSITSQK